MRRRRLDVERLAEAQQAARVAGASAGRWWHRLSTAAETVTTEKSLDVLLSESIAAMRDALEVDTVAILLANEAGDELVARFAPGLGPGASFGSPIRAGEGVAGVVLANRRPLIVANLAKVSVTSSELRSSRLRSVVAVPIMTDDHPLGVLYAGSYELNRFSTQDSAVLELLADRLGLAIERVRLFETEHAARTGAEAVAIRLARIQRITAGLAAATTAQDVATTLVNALTEDSEPPLAAVWVARGDALVPMAGPAFDTGPVPAMYGDHPLARAARSGEAQYHEEPAAPWLFDSASQSSLAVVPIMLGPSCLGVIALAYPPGAIAAEERGLLETVVGQAALALERARLSATQDQAAQISAFFARAAKVLAEGSDLADTLQRLGTVALPALGDICLIDVLGEDGGIERMVALHRDPTRQHLLDQLRTRYPPQMGGPNPVASVIATGKTRWSEHLTDSMLAETTRDAEHLAIMRQLRVRSFISVPLRSGDETLGCITLVSASRTFDADDVAFAEQLAEQVAALVNKARRYDIAARTSHILQSTLLPQRFVEMPGLIVHTRYVAASEGLEVGGDFFDVVPVSEQTVAFMIGDVAGHDHVAAGMMGQLRSAARTLAGRVASPAELIADLQESWATLDFDRIATAIFGELEVPTGAVTLASAGHHPPLVIDAGTTRYLELLPGSPLGVLGQKAEPWRGELSPGQVLLLYTDGALDERRVGSEAAMAGLAAAVASDWYGPLDGNALCDRVVSRLSANRVDDVALLALQLTAS